VRRAFEVADVAGHGGLSMGGFGGSLTHANPSHSHRILLTQPNTAELYKLTTSAISVCETLHAADALKRLGVTYSVDVIR
jgi:hypothetical protein